MVLESSTSNFFIVKGGDLITSADGVLMGITRGFVIDIAKDSFGVEERPIKFDELAMTDEAFITATNKEILSVTRIGDLTIGSGSVGAATKELMSLFKERADSLIEGTVREMSLRRIVIEDDFGMFHFIPTESDA